MLFRSEVAFQQILTKPAAASNATKAITGNITVPAAVRTGTTRMRVSMKRGAYATPCETFANGEVEDYTVTITQNLLAGADRKAEHPSVLENLKNQEGAQLFPNPAGDILNIFGMQKSCKIQIINQLGQVILTK